MLDVESALLLSFTKSYMCMFKYVYVQAYLPLILATSI